MMGELFQPPQGFIKYSFIKLYIFILFYQALE